MMDCLDPPHLISSDNLYGSRRGAYKGFDHEEPASILRKRDKRVFSYNDCPEIRELYKHARILEPKESEELLIVGPEFLE